MRKNLETKFHQKDNYQGYPPCKIFGTILEIDEGNFQQTFKGQKS